MITIDDMRHQVMTALAGWENEFDIDGIVGEIRGKVGLCDIGALPTSLWNAVIARYDRRRAATGSGPGHPEWCARQHPRGEPSGTVRHYLELLTLSVMDADLTQDVPLTVAVERTDDPDDGPGQTRTVLSIGHALYQPTEVILSASDRARLAAALLTAQALEMVENA